MRPVFLIAALWASGVWAQSEGDSVLVPPPISQMEVYAEGQWASNALNKFVLAGFAFGGDISSPVRSTTSLTHWKGRGFAGGTTRAGVRMVLPALELFKPQRVGRWKTVIGLETAQWASAFWSPAAATLVFGRHGIGNDGSLKGVRYNLTAATLLRIGGVRTVPMTLRRNPLLWSVEWGVRMGELHRSIAGGVHRGSEYQWTDEVAEGRLNAMQFRNLSSGSALAFDLAMVWEEAHGGQGRPDRWSVSLRNLGKGGRWQTEVALMDTAFSTPGWALITGEGPDFSGAVQRDTLLDGFERSLPHTLSFRWDRGAIRLPGVVWSLTAEKLSIAPRWEWALIRRSGRGAVHTEVGLAYGGFGGTFIPLNFNFPSRAVRQGRPGGTLAIRTRWLALAGTGGRMGLGIHWQRTF